MTRKGSGAAEERTQHAMNLKYLLLTVFLEFLAQSKLYYFGHILKSACLKSQVLPEYYVEQFENILSPFAHFLKMSFFLQVTILGQQKIKMYINIYLKKKEFYLMRAFKGT